MCMYYTHPRLLVNLKAQLNYSSDKLELTRNPIDR